MEYMIAAVSIFGGNYIEALPLVIALFHVIYRNGRWGWFTIGIFWKLAFVWGAWTQMRRNAEQNPLSYFIIETAVGVLFTLFFYFLIRLELRKRDKTENKIAD